MPLTSNGPALTTIHDFEPESGDFQSDVLTGLAQPQKQVPAKYFYDQEGSRLFDEICRLDEYYPTRTEIGILTKAAPEIGALVPRRATVIEFGAGSVEKIRLLMDALGEPRRYVPIDISREHLLDNAESFAADFPDLSVAAVCADFTQRVDLADVVPREDRVGFFPGSTIGNFTPEAARLFLAEIAATLGAGGVLIIGVDLVKAPAVLEAAYDDHQNVTARFNLNLLRRINRDLDADFDLTAFRHRAIFNADKSRVEMHLESLADQTVIVAGERFAFKNGETIHTENSYKYTIEAFQALADEAGFDAERVWTDAEALFSVHALKVR